MYKRILSVIDSISEWSGKGVAFLVVAATVVITLEVTLRYVFDAPTIWGLELAIYLCAAVYILGGAYAHASDSHVRVDIIYGRFTPRLRAIVDLVTFPLLLGICGVLLWTGGEWTLAALIGGKTSGSQWSPPIWPMRALIPAAALLLLLQALVNFVRSFNVAIRGRQ